MKSSTIKPGPATLEQRQVDGADIVLVCNSLNGGGIQRVVTNLARGWTNRGRQVQIITIRDQPDTYRLASGVARAKIDKPVELPPLFLRLQALLAPVYELKPILPVLTILKIRRLIVQSGAPIVIGFGSNGAAPLTVVACRGLKKRVIVSERNDPSRQVVGQPWEGLRRKYYNRADVVTANSAGALRSLAAFVDAAKLKYVPNPLAVPAEVDDPPPEVAARRPYILNVARLHPQKAQDVLLRAFARFAARHPDWHLVILGSGELDGELIALAESLGVADRVYFAGYSQEPFPYYKTASLFALPSRYEGMPNALMEAMAFGLPCIVSDGSPGPLDLIAHEKTGLVAPVGDDAALLAAFERLAADAELGRRLGAAARRRVQPFQLEAALDTWEDVIGLKPAP